MLSMKSKKGKDILSSNLNFSLIKLSAVVTAEIVNRD